MQIFSAIEECLPKSVKALLLGSAIFGSSAGTARGWQELSMPERPAATAQDIVAKPRASERAFEIRNQGELKEVWSTSQKVYAEASILNNSVLRSELNTLQQTLAKDSSDWTVIVVAPQMQSSRGVFRFSSKEDLDKRAEEMHRNLSTLERFSKDENLLIIELTPNKNSEVRTAYSPSAKFSEFGPSKEQWKTGLGADFVESLKIGTPLSQIVSTAINKAVTQKETRSAINQQEQLAALTNAIARFPKIRDEIIDSVTQIEESIKPDLRESVNSGFELKRANVVKHLDAAESAFRDKQLDEGNRELMITKQVVAELKEIVGQLSIGFENLLGLRQYIITSKDYSFLDDPGRKALADAEIKADQLERELYALERSGGEVSSVVTELFQVTNTIVSQDVSQEAVALFLSSPFVVVGGLLAIGVTVQVVSKMRDSLSRSWQEATDKRKTLQDRLASTTELLDTIDSALKIKRNFMRDTMIPEALNFDTKIDERSDTGDQLRSAAVQGWRVLNKLEEIVKNARQLVALGNIESLDEAQALVGSAPVAVEEDDSLGFMKSVNEWNEKAALGDPKDYNPATVTFNQLHEEFVRLAQICKGL
jgi:hypothetical protein